jgi:hypothetical protein
MSIETAISTVLKNRVWFMADISLEGCIELLQRRYSTAIRIFIPGTPN